MCEYCQKYPHAAGCPNAPEQIYHCPVCDGELDGSDFIYLDKDGDITGCCKCIKELFAVTVL